MIQHATPSYILAVNGTPLGTETREWIREVTLEQVSDGADILTIDCDAWDAIGNKFRIADERPLFPGNEIELWAGYGPGGPGSPDWVCKGLFKIHSREPSYTSEGVTVQFIGYDRLKEMAEANQARAFRGFRRDSDLVRDLVTNARYGYRFDASTVPALPLLPNAPLNASRDELAAIEPTPEMKGDRIKPRGMSDLAWIKRMAEGFGYAYPKIRYSPGKGGRRGRETFVFRPVGSGPDAWTQTFWWRKPGDPSQADLLSFSTAFQNDAPAGVEIVGWDRRRGVPIRVVARVTPGGEPVVTWDNDVIAGEKIEGEIKNGSKLRMSVLGSGEQVVQLRRTRYAGQTWTPEKSVNEALTIDMIRGRPDMDEHALEDIARSWLYQRQAAWFTCSADLANQPGLHLLDSDQVHEFRGLMPMDEGHYITLRVVHTWSDGSHKVSLEGQKLITEEALQIERQSVES